MFFFLFFLPTLFILTLQQCNKCTPAIGELIEWPRQKYYYIQVINYNTNALCIEVKTTKSGLQSADVENHNMHDELSINK